MLLMPVRYFRAASVALVYSFPAFTGTASAEAGRWIECQSETTIECVLDLAFDAAKHEQRHASGNSMFGRMWALHNRAINDVSFSNSLDGYSAKSNFLGGYALGLLDQGKYKEASQVLGTTLGGTKARRALITKLIEDGKFDAAASIAARASRDGPRQEFLGIAAKAFASGGIPEKGMKLLLDEMGVVLEDDKDDIPGRLCWLLAAAVDLHVQGTDLPDAMVAASLALEIEDTYQREAALEDVAKCLSGNGRFRDSIKTASVIEDEDDRYELFGDIVGAMAKSGDLTGAFRVVDRIPEGNIRKSFAYDDLARALIDRGDLDNAENIIEISEFTRPRGTLRAQLAVSFLNNGNEDKASENATKALEAYDTEDAGSFSAWLTLQRLQPVSNLLPKVEVESRLEKAKLTLLDADKSGSYIFAMAAETLAAYGDVSSGLQIIERNIPEEERLSALASVVSVMQERAIAN